MPCLRSPILFRPAHAQTAVGATKFSPVLSRDEPGFRRKAALRDKDGVSTSKYAPGSVPIKNGPTPIPSTRIPRQLEDSSQGIPTSTFGFSDRAPAFIGGTSL